MEVSRRKNNFKLNENENIIFQYSWDIVKEEGHFKIIFGYWIHVLEKGKDLKVDNLNFHLEN